MTSNMNDEQNEFLSDLKHFLWCFTRAWRTNQPSKKPNKQPTDRPTNQPISQPTGEVLWLKTKWKFSLPYKWKQSCTSTSHSWSNNAELLGHTQGQTKLDFKDTLKVKQSWTSRSHSRSNKAELQGHAQGQTKLNFKVTLMVKQSWTLRTHSRSNKAELQGHTQAFSLFPLLLSSLTPDTHQMLNRFLRRDCLHEAPDPTSFKRIKNKFLSTPNRRLLYHSFTYAKHQFRSYLHNLGWL